MTWQELLEIAKPRKSVRCGETKDIHERRGEYSRQRKYKDTSYTMYHFKTENVRKRENDLLQVKDWERNVERVSNAHDVPGYVYVIRKD